MTRFCPSTQPRSRKPPRSSVTKTAPPAGIPENTIPMRFGPGTCCASTRRAKVRSENVKRAIVVLIFMCRSFIRLSGLLFLAQGPAQDLADVGLRQLGAELDVLR